MADIILGFDGTRSARAALEVAVTQARAFGDRLVVVFADEPPGRSAGEEFRQHRQAIDEIAERAFSEAKETARNAGIEVETLLVNERPPVALETTARGRETRLIVVGTYGEGPFRSAILGSTPHKLLHFSEVPVLCVPSPARTPLTTIRPIRPEDHEAWLPLWRGYNDFYRNDPTDEVTRTTFGRLCDGSDGLYGLVAEEDGELVGLAHAIFHPSTWTTGTYCYLEDLFVSRAGRGSGAGRALIEGVYAEADRRGADRVYWHTQQYNAPARSLYDVVANATSFVVYER